jgi:hypothetical protein
MDMSSKQVHFYHRIGFNVLTKVSFFPTFIPYEEQIVSDVVNRTETAMSQAHCFLATELALTAQKIAR